MGWFKKSVVVVLYQREMLGLLPAKFVLGKQREFTNQVLGGSFEDRRKWLGSASSTSHEVRPFGRGPTTLLRGLTITMVISHVSESWDDPPSTSL